MIKGVVPNLFEKTIYQVTSPINGEIKVVESNGIRRLLVQGYTQSKTLDKNGLAEGYWDSFRQVTLLKIVPKKALILGLGAGTIPIIWQEEFPKLEIDIVEIDPLIAQVSQKYFDLPKSLQTYITDGANFVFQTKNTYDLIVVDVYSGGDFDRTCETEEFIQNLARIVTPQGVVIFNRIYSLAEMDDQNLFVDKLRKYFAKVDVRKPQNKTPSFNVIISATG